MEFYFIDNNLPLDRQSKKLVRIHAMKGKNLGKTVPARGHKRQQFEDGIHPGQTTTKPIPFTQLEHSNNTGRLLLPKVVPRPGTDTASANAKGMASPLLVNPYCGAELSYFAIPVPLTPSIRYLFCELHHTVSKELYPRIFCHQSKEAQKSWFECVISNPCVFHCALAMTGAHISRFLGHRQKSLESTRHFMQAMRLLRHDLAATAEPQDSSVAVVISLAVHANLTGAVDQSRIHMHGLKRILNLRPGGLAAICSHTPELGNKIRRADLELALVAGTPTIFGSQSSPSPLPPPASPYVGVIPLDDGRALRVKVAQPYPLTETCVAVHSAMRDALALCSCANSAVQLDAFRYQDLVISIFQRLVDYAPPGGLRPPHQLDDVCQLGLLAFMTTILHHTRQRQSAHTALLSNVFRIQLGLFESDMVSRQDNKYPSLRIWLIFIYAVSAPGYEQFCDVDSFVAQNIRTLAKTLTLGRWKDVAAHLSGYPWVAAIHNKPGKKLWESVTCGADEETEI